MRRATPLFLCAARNIIQTTSLYVLLLLSLQVRPALVLFICAERNRTVDERFRFPLDGFFMRKPFAGIIFRFGLMRRFPNAQTNNTNIRYTSQPVLIGRVVPVVSSEKSPRIEVWMRKKKIKIVSPGRVSTLASVLIQKKKKKSSFQTWQKYSSKQRIFCEKNISLGTRIVWLEVLELLLYDIIFWKK